MSYELVRKHVNLTGLYQSGRSINKDSLLVVIVFLIGLLGTCYILHFTTSSESTAGYQMYESQNDVAEPEAIYVTQENR